MLCLSLIPNRDFDFNVWSLVIANTQKKNTKIEPFKF